MDMTLWTHSSDLRCFALKQSQNSVIVILTLIEPVESSGKIGPILLSQSKSIIYLTTNSDQ